MRGASRTKRFMPGAKNSAWMILNTNTLQMAFDRTVFDSVGGPGRAAVIEVTSRCEQVRYFRYYFGRQADTFRIEDKFVTPLDGGLFGTVA